MCELRQVIFADFAGTVGWAIWDKSFGVVIERKIVKRQWCCEVDSCGKKIKCKVKSEDPVVDKYFDIHYDRLRTTAYRFFAGSDPEGGDYWWTTDPCTGKTVGSNMPD